MPAYYIILDLEMNPTDTVIGELREILPSETIEIGAVKIEAGTNRIVDEFSRVICPEFNSQIEPRITQLTKITTAEVLHADPFDRVLADFTQWMGSEPVRIYSWSDSDYLQLRTECDAKCIPFPEVFENWVDFQAEYPRYLGYTEPTCLSLKKAARLIGATVTSRKAHRALYDAQITSQLVLFALTGAYLHYTSAISQDKSSMTYSIADACGGKLSALLAKLNEREENPYGNRSFTAAPAFVR